MNDGAGGGGGGVLLSSAAGTITNDGLIDTHGGVSPRSGDASLDGPVAIHGVLSGTGTIQGIVESVPAGVANADFILDGAPGGGGGGGEGIAGPAEVPMLPVGIVSMTLLVTTAGFLLLRRSV